MNTKLMFRNLLLLLAVIISYFFIFVTYDDCSLIQILVSGEITTISECLFLVTFGVNIVLIDKLKKYKKKKLYLVCLVIVTLFNGIVLTYLLWLMFVNPILAFGTSDYSPVYVYFLVLSTCFVTSLFDREDNINNLNYFLTILVSVIIILIHYRYYVDRGFLHNMINISSASSYSSEPCNYIIQYYNYFIVLLVILFFQKKINEVK